MIIVPGKYMMNLLPHNGFHRSNSPAPIPQTNAPIFEPQRMAARKLIRLPMCHTPNGEGMGTDTEVVMYTRAVNMLINANFFEVGVREEPFSTFINNTLNDVQV